MVAERAPPFVDAAANCTVPPPEPAAPDVIVSQAAFETAVHGKSGAFAVTVKLAVPPDGGTVTCVRPSVTEPVMPVCVTVKV